MRSLWPNLKSIFPWRKLNWGTIFTHKISVALKKFSVRITFIFLYCSSKHSVFDVNRSVIFSGIETVTSFVFFEKIDYVPFADTLTSAIPPRVPENAYRERERTEGMKDVGEKRTAGRKHSARKSLNLHESQPVVTFQCPLAFRSLKCRLISRNGWGSTVLAYRRYSVGRESRERE